MAVEGLTIRFGGVTALDNVSFEVARGAICGLIGPNGAGKTTLFNCISRLYDPHAGSIVFDGRPLASCSRHELASLGIARTFQNVALFSTMTRARKRLRRRARARARRIPRPMRWRAARATRGEDDRRAGRRADRGIRPRGRRGPSGGRVAVRSSQAGRARARARQRAKAVAARRAGRRAQSLGGRRARRRNPRHPRPPRRRRAAGRASHESGHAGQRPGGRARLRPGDRQRQAGRGAGPTPRWCAPISGARIERADPGGEGSRSLVRPGAGAARRRFRGRRRRRDRAARRQRRRQDDDPARAERPHPPHGRHPFSRPADRRAGDRGHRASWASRMCPTGAARSSI